MLTIVPEAIDQYANQFTTPEDEVLAELNRITHLKTLSPQMLSGHLQGKILSLISRLVQPSRIMEIGTFTGYSAICLAKGLTESGLLYTIDINVEFTDIAAEYFQKSGLKNKIKQHIGEGGKIIPLLNEKWDLVFIDADKTNYSNYFDLVIENVRTGGLIIADNVLWSGRVLDENKDTETRALYDYSVKVSKDSRVESLLLPVRDGLMIARKL